jgi:hypothetical protein
VGGVAFLFDYVCVQPGEPGMSTRLLDIVAKLGDSGSLSGNVYRDLLRRLPKSGMPTPHKFMVPLVHSVFGFMDQSMDMILPHELFACIYHNYPHAFWKYIIPSSTALLEFWDAVKGGMCVAIWEHD